MINEIKNYLSIGHRTNLLVMISDPYYKKYGRQMSKFSDFKCDCGKELSIKLTDLKNRISCGCVRKNIKGIKFNKLTPIRPEKENTGKRSRWKWRCICDCGKERLVEYNELKSGHIKSCGCYRKEISKSRKGTKYRPKEKNIGKTFGDFKILDYIETSEKMSMPHYLCECICGLVFKIVHSNLILRRGCISCKNINKKYGNLTVISIKTKPVVATCLCDCGKYIDSLLDVLKSGQKIDCGCGKKERKIAASLKARKGCGEVSGEYFSRLRASARLRKINFNLEVKDLWDLYLIQNGKCALSGIDIPITYENIGKASIDRIDSLLEYNKNNIQWIYSDINFMKIDMVQDNFIELCKKISCFNKNINYKEIIPSEKDTKWKGVGDISNKRFKRISNDAKKRNREFDININYLWQLFKNQGGICALSGEELMFAKIGETASLDRINSKIGYIEGNVQWLHRDVNFMKGPLDQNYFLDICRKIYEYNS